MGARIKHFHSVGKFTCYCDLHTREWAFGAWIEQTYTGPLIAVRFWHLYVVVGLR